MSEAIRESWRKKYNKSLDKHLKYYREAAMLLGVDRKLIKIHDASKLAPEEYTAYVRKFGGGIKDREEFDRAWLHHIHANPHHPEHWILPGDHGEKDAVLEMPEKYALEMVADWLGSSKAYTGSFDMTDWLIANLPKKRLHEVTLDYVLKVLSTKVSSEIPVYDLVDLVHWREAMKYDI